MATTASAANFELVQALGADVLIDYKTQDFETMLHGYDVVLHSQDSKTLDKSLRAEAGGTLVSISGPPDPAFADEIGVPWYVKPIIRVLSFGARRKAKRLNVSYSFLFMRANGAQLSEITALIDQGVIRPVVERVFPFESTQDALDFVGKGTGQRQGRRQREVETRRCHRRQNRWCVTPLGLGTTSWSNRSNSSSGDSHRRDPTPTSTRGAPPRGCRRGPRRGTVG